MVENQVKKEYVQPVLVVYGDMTVLTQGGGNHFVDSPGGTPIGNCCS